MYNFYLGSEPWILDLASKEFPIQEAQREEQYGLVGLPSPKPSRSISSLTPFRASAFKARTVSREEKMLNQLTGWRNHFTEVEEDDLLTIKSDFIPKQTFKTAKNLLELANLHCMMRPCRSNERIRRDAREAYRYAKARYEKYSSSSRLFI